MSSETGASARRSGWAAAGPGGGDAAYRTQSLKYTPIELSLDESVPWQVLFRLWLTAAVVSWIVFMVFFLLWLITGGASSSSTDAFGASSGPDFGLVSVGTLVSFIVFWLVLLLSRLPEPIAEWKVLLEEKAGAAEYAYAAIYGSLARRRIPVTAVPARVRSDVLTREIVNNRLVISERGYVAYATVFAYGTSLYVGWTMWRNRFGAQLIGTFFKDLIGGMLGRTGVINQMLRTEKVRAMREAVHSAVREGVEVAIEGIEVPIVSTFGYEVPIQDLTLQAPQPAPPAPPSPQSFAPRPPMPQPQAPMPQQYSYSQPQQPEPQVAQPPVHQPMAPPPLVGAPQPPSAGQPEHAGHAGHAGHSDQQTVVIPMASQPGPDRGQQQGHGQGHAVGQPHDQAGSQHPDAAHTQAMQQSDQPRQSQQGPGFEPPST